MTSATVSFPRSSASSSRAIDLDSPTALISMLPILFLMVLIRREWRVCTSGCRSVLLLSLSIVQTVPLHQNTRHVRH